MNRLIRAASAGLLAVGMVAAVGCSKNFAPEETLPESGASMKGTVSYGGEQLHYAMIRVKGNNHEATGKIGPDGTYLVENCPVGPITIGVNTDAGKGDYQSALMAGGAYTGPDGKGRKRVSLKLTEVPKKFFDPNTSGLTHTLSVGVNSHNIEIKK